MFTADQWPHDSPIGDIISFLSSSLIVAAAAESENVLPFPPIVFAAIAASVFIVLGFVAWSYRDVANRHSDKVRAKAGHAPEHH